MSPKARVSNRAQRRRKAKLTGKKVTSNRTVLVDRLAVDQKVIDNADDPISTVFGLIVDWIESAVDNNDADIFEETSIRFGRHPSPAFAGELVIELQTVQKPSTPDLSFDAPAPVDDDGEPLYPVTPGGALTGDDAPAEETPQERKNRLARERRAQARKEAKAAE